MCDCRHVLLYQHDTDNAVNVSSRYGHQHTHTRRPQKPGSTVAASSKFHLEMSTSLCSVIRSTDLHIYNLDAAPLVYVMWTLISLPLQMAVDWVRLNVPPTHYRSYGDGVQMAERLRRAQLDSVANHVKARQSLIERAVTWSATESGWARRKSYAICSGKLCGGSIISDQCCPCGSNQLMTTPRV